MKKILFILALLISSPLIYAQELTVTPDGLRDKSNVEKTYVIIAAPNKTAEQSYNNIITYINKTYKNPQEVIKKLYGKKALTVCKISHNHEITATGNININYSKDSNTQYDCSKLPLQIY